MALKPLTWLYVQRLNEATTRVDMGIFWLQLRLLVILKLHLPVRYVCIHPKPWATFRRKMFEQP